jgi:rhomboid protease GluP
MAQCIRCGRVVSGFGFGRRICVWCKQHEAAQRGEETRFQPPITTPWQRREPMPMIATQAIFGINIAVFIGMLLGGASLMSPTGDVLLQWGANFGPYTLGGQWWRLLTSCFVHIGLLHIAFNMWCLWFLGELAEQLYGHATFAGVYLLCGLSGSLASIWWHRAPTLSAGASGAIFGIAGAVIASIKLGDFHSGVMARGTMQSLIAFIGYNVVFGILVGTTDNACHFGGLLAGLLLGALIAKVAPQPRMLPRFAVLTLVAALLGCAGYALHRSRAYPYLLMRATDALQDGKLAEARNFFGTAVKLRPQSAAAIHAQLAQACLEQKDVSGAEQELRMAIQADPGNEAAINNLAEFQLALHRSAEARQSFAHLLTLDPRSAQAHAGMGAVDAAENNTPAALEEYSRAAELNPKLPGVQEQRGACLLHLHRYDEAIAAFKAEIELGAAEAVVYPELAAAYRAKGMTAEANAAEQQAKLSSQPQ